MIDDLARCENALRVAIEHGSWDTALKVKVRSMVGEELAAVVMATANLQHKARAKLGDGIWWCTERSLSQATPYQVADRKARWLDSSSLFDMCCGLGSDTVAIARSRRRAETTCVAVDRDPAMTAMTSENLRLNGAPACSANSVVCDDVVDVQIPPASAIHIDPDRRDEAGRKTRPQDYSPTWEVVEQLIGRCDAAIVKLAPAAELDDHPQRHRVWISLAGSVREQTLLTETSIERASADLGEALAPAGRSGVAVRADGSATVFTASVSTSAGVWCEKPLQFMVDPDASIRAAGLTESFADRRGLQMLGGPAGFLTGDGDVAGDLAICEPVIWSGACDDRKLRKTLRGMNSYPWRIKTRGVSQNPNVLQKRFRPCGERPVTLWIGKGSKRQYAVITAR